MCVCVCVGVCACLSPHTFSIIKFHCVGDEISSSPGTTQRGGITTTTTSTRSAKKELMEDGFSFPKAIESKVAIKKHLHILDKQRGSEQSGVFRVND